MIVTQPKEAIGLFVARCLGMQSVEWGEFSAIGNVRDGALVAGVIYNHYSTANICMHVGGVGKYWLTPDFLHAAFDYPFNQLKLRRVTGLVPKKNKAARTLDEHLGFTLEGCMRQGLPDDDMLVYGLLKKDCKWISDEFCARLARRSERRSASSSSATLRAAA
jgi:RimJ/RimL family protein N-acetyltransferase